MGFKYILRFESVRDTFGLKIGKGVKRMKKLGKKTYDMTETIEAYVYCFSCSNCGCSCSCGVCGSSGYTTYDAIFNSGYQYASGVNGLTYNGQVANVG